MKTEYTQNGTYITIRTHKHNNMNAYTRTGVYLLSNTNIWWTYIYIYIYICIFIYYIGNNYMFRYFSLAIFRLINEKLAY